MAGGVLAHAPGGPAAVPVHAVAPQRCCGMTDAMIKKVALGILAGLALAAAATLIVLASMSIICIVAGFFAIPLAIAGGIAIWGIFQIKDYDDPASLAQYRNDAPFTPFDQLASEHGWDNIFRHQILEPATFTDRCRQEFGRLSLNHCLDLREAILRAFPADGYELPPGNELLPKYVAETRGRSAAAILDRYNEDRLNRHGVLAGGSAHIQGLRAARPLHDRIGAVTAAAERQIQRRVREMAATERALLWRAKAIYSDSQSNHINASSALAAAPMNYQLQRNLQLSAEIESGARTGVLLAEAALQAKLESLRPYVDQQRANIGQARRIARDAVQLQFRAAVDQS